MKLCHQIATLDVAIVDSVTTYQGSLGKSFGDLGRLGYDKVELTALNPGEPGWNEVEEVAEKNELPIALVCAGEVFGQLGLSYMNPRKEIRREVIRRSGEIIDFAGFLGANINIGRVRGQHCNELSREEAKNLAMGAFRELADYGVPENVKVALETATIMRTNFTNILAEGIIMVDHTDHPNFRLIMNVFHLNPEEKDIHEAIRRCNPYNIHVHLADNNRRCPGYCGLNFGKVLTISKECGYNGSFRTGIFQIPSMEEAAAGIARHLRPIADRAYGREV